MTTPPTADTPPLEEQDVEKIVATFRCLLEQGLRMGTHGLVYAEVKVGNGRVRVWEANLLARDQPTDRRRP